MLNSHFQATLNITASKASGLSAAYFRAYLLRSLTISRWILRRYGFRVTVSCLLFWPSGVKASFGGFCGSMFVVGAGLSTLETGAGNFLSICGPPRCSEIRLNLAQGIQGVGSFVAPLLASRVFSAKTMNTKEGLKNVQWVYLGVACFVALLIILFYLAPMPEVTNADMHLQEEDIAGEYTVPFASNTASSSASGASCVMLALRWLWRTTSLTSARRPVIALLCLGSIKQLVKYSSFLGSCTNTLLANHLAIGQGSYALTVSSQRF